ncbi:hypothetical protein TWF106_006245 [Orbilia oligospora]|uniref:F-box domain-containing protein n=1 Tax=Orbilia oligospora TaxID=2813651 RepID=A0A6G1M9F5_ORBOL|nr:hypothetical protein TWF106_006245 [Orbilia oligospora]KAF3230805.1 hypothetical protein TWF191_008645 [Orbilia oligospora]KAF3250287.1 hypothetical protein TWF192_005309 [Orbilia oligospora]
MESPVQDSFVPPIILRIPQELLLEIGKQLTLFDIYSLRNSCRVVHTRLGPQEQSIWHHLLSPDASRKPIYWKRYLNKDYNPSYEVIPTRPDCRPTSNTELEKGPGNYYLQAKMIRNGELAGCQMCLAQVACSDTYRAMIFWKWVCASCLYYYFRGSIAHVAIKHPHNRFDPNLIISHTARCSPIPPKAPSNRFKQYLLSDIDRVVQEQLDSTRKPNTSHQRFCTSVPFLIEFLCQMYARPTFKGFHRFWSVEELQDRWKEMHKSYGIGRLEILGDPAEAYSAMEELTPALIRKNMESERRIRDMLYFYPMVKGNSINLQGATDFLIPEWIQLAFLEWVDVSKLPPDGIPFDKVRLCPYCEKLTEESLYNYIFQTVGRYKRCNEHPGKEISGTRLLAKHIYMFHFENLYEDWVFKPASLEFYSKLETFLHS